MASQSSSVDEGYKVVIVGAAKVGKTSLIQRFCFNDSNHTVPQVATEEKKTISTKKGAVTLRLCDMAEQTDLVTRKYYSDTKAVVFVYDITNPNSLFEAESWIKDLKLYLNEELSVGLPILFVGNKSDEISNDPDQLIAQEEGGEDNQVTLKQARVITDREGFMRPMECSARTGEGVDKVFQRIANEVGGSGSGDRWCKYL